MSTNNEESYVTPEDADHALKFLAKSGSNDEPVFDQTRLKALRRRVDWQIIPLFFLCYTMSFLDKVILNVSRKST
mgnify:CR=1 FL=1